MSERPQQRQSVVDNLRMQPRDQEELLCEMGSEGVRYHGGERRTEDRQPFRATPGVIVQMRHPGGTTVNYLVAPRNLSRNGLGFLHGSFVYTNTPCTLLLKTIDGRAVKIDGKVANCRFVRGHIHEVGIQFAEPLRLADFVPADLAGDSPSDSTELPALEGNVLYIEDSIDDQELVKFMLANVGVELRTAGNGDEGLSLAKQGAFDLILTDMRLPGADGLEIAAHLRKQGFTGPIYLFTADESDQVKTEAQAKGCTGVLTKPCKSEVLIQTLANHLRRQPAGAPDEQPLMSTKWGDAKMRQLILGYLTRMDVHLKEIGKLLGSTDNVDLLKKLCLDIKGSAGGYGYPAISEAAHHLLQLAGEKAPLDKLQAQFQELAKLAVAAGRVREQMKKAS